MYPLEFVTYLVDNDWKEEHGKFYKHRGAALYCLEISVDEKIKMMLDFVPDSQVENVHCFDGYVATWEEFLLVMLEHGLQ